MLLASGARSAARSACRQKRQKARARYITQSALRLNGCLAIAFLRQKQVKVSPNTCAPRWMFCLSSKVERHRWLPPRCRFCANSRKPDLERLGCSRRRPAISARQSSRRRRWTHGMRQTLSRHDPESRSRQNVADGAIHLLLLA